MLGFTHTHTLTTRAPPLGQCACRLHSRGYTSFSRARAHARQAHIAQTILCCSPAAARTVPCSLHCAGSFSEQCYCYVYYGYKFTLATHTFALGAGGHPIAHKLPCIYALRITWRDAGAARDREKNCDNRLRRG